MKPFISIVFPNWNWKDNTINLLMSLENLSYPKNRIEIICVDNWSNDWSQDEIKKYFDIMSKDWASKKIICLDKNYWATYAYNTWYRESSKNKNFLWKLDNDIILDKEALNNLLYKFHEHNNLWIAWSIVFPLYSYTDMWKNLDWEWEIWCKINFITTNITKKTIKYNEINNYKNNEFYDITYSIWCSNLISNEVLNKIWFLDEDFFLYYDDSYFSYLTKKNGFDLLTVTNSIVYHKWSASTWWIMKPLWIYYTTLSENIFFNKTMPFFQFLISYWFIFIKRFILTFYRLLYSKNFNTLLEWIWKFFEANKIFILWKYKK